MTWDMTCPHCGHQIDMFSKHEAHDYEPSFDLDCPECEAPIHCIVHQVREFQLVAAEVEGRVEG